MRLAPSNSFSPIAAFSRFLTTELMGECHLSTFSVVVLILMWVDQVHSLVTYAVHLDGCIYFAGIGYNLPSRGYD